MLKWKRHKINNMFLFFFHSIIINIIVISNHHNDNQHHYSTSLTIFTIFVIITPLWLLHLSLLLFVKMFSIFLFLSLFLINLTAIVAIFRYIYFHKFFFIFVFLLLSVSFFNQYYVGFINFLSVCRIVDNGNALVHHLIYLILINLYAFKKK